MGLLFLIAALIMALTLHEFAHAWTSNWLGDPTAKAQGRLTLNPASHIDPFMTLLLPLLLIVAGSPVVFGAAKPVPFNPWAVRYGKWGSALVAVAGPLTNLALASFFALWLRFVPLGQQAISLMVTIIIINIAFFIFNMIPIPPLDGSRVLYAMAPLGLRTIMDRIERAGLMFVMIFLLVAFPLISRFVAAGVSFFLQFLVPGLTGLSGGGAI